MSSGDTIVLATGTGIGTGCILTNGNTTLIPTPSKILESNGFNQIQSLSTSTEATYFINDGKVYSFGKGQLGNGDNKEKKTVPEEITYLKDVKDNDKIRFSKVYSSSHKDNNFCFLQGENGILLSFGNSMDFRTALGSEIESNLPRYVSGLDSPVTLVSLGICHGVIVTVSGSIYLFGRPFGFDSEPIPTPLKFSDFSFTSPDNSQLDPLVQVVSGEEFSLFLTESGKVYGIGNGESQCLLDPENKLLKPTLLSFIPEPIKQISCGNTHCLALSITNKLYTWGSNQNGSLGINEQNYSFTLNSKAEIVNILNVKNICSSLYQNFIIDENNDVYSWGYNVNGNLGTNNNRNYILPEKIDNLSNKNIESISIGQNYTIFLCKETLPISEFKPIGYIINNKISTNLLYPEIPNFIYNNNIQNNSVWCTGSIFATNNEIGDDQTNFKPMTSLQSYQASSLAIGNRSGYMVTTEGDVYCWGSGYALSQGIKGEPCREITKIHDLPSGKSVRVFSSQDDVCFVTNEKGNLYSFGRSKNFLTGQGSDEDDVVYPRLMEGFKSACGISKVVISNTHCLALDREGNIYAWGTGKALGNRSRSQMEKQPKKIQDQAYIAIDIGCGNNYSLYLSDSGKIFSFGEGLKGQLGLGDNKFSSLPTLISKLKDERVVSISSSHTYSSAITDKGELYFWGNNPDQILNFIEKPDPLITSVKDLIVPTKAPRFTNQQLHHLVLSEKNIFAITCKGSLYAWGEPHLGIGSGIKIYQPTLVESTQTLCVLDVNASDWQCLCLISKKSQDLNYQEPSLKLPNLNQMGTLLSPPTSPNGSILLTSIEGSSSNPNNNNTGEVIDPEEISRHEDYIKNQTDEIRFWNNIDREIDINTWCGKIQEIKDFLNRSESYQSDPNTMVSIQHSQKIIKPGERVIKGWVLYSINHKDYEAERIVIITTENIYRIKYDWKKLEVITYKIFPLASIYKVKIGKFADWKPMIGSNLRKNYYEKEYGIQIWFQNPANWKPPTFVNPLKKLNYPFITLRPAISLNSPTAFEDQQLIIHEMGTAIQCAIHFKRNSNKPIELLHKFSRESPGKWNELPPFPVRKVEQLQRLGGLISWGHNKFISKTQKGFIDPQQSNNNNNKK